jgi:protein phosphatase
MTIGAGLTDKGLVREMNEDAFFISIDDNGQAFAMVADGMGGHQAGEVASNMACQIISEHILTGMQPGNSDCEELLYEAIEKANQAIYHKSLEDVHKHGMGTTIVTVIATGYSLWVAHVGDSRLYLLHNGQLQPLTSDHSHVQSLVNEGLITPAEARIHPKRNIILRALGTDHDVEIDYAEFQWQAGDQLLLCSDGLSNMLDDLQIRDILMSSHSPLEQLRQCIDAANQAGGDDNITAIILHNMSQEI